jgi:hypothetical protein
MQGTRLSSFIKFGQAVWRSHLNEKVNTQTDRLTDNRLQTAQCHKSQPYHFVSDQLKNI